MGKIKELIWCASGTLEFIIFEDYKEELVKILTKLGWNIVENFDLSKPPSVNAPEEIKERALTQSTRHYARLLYRREFIVKDNFLCNYYKSFIDKQNERFKRKVEEWMKAIEINPSIFFPELNKNSINKDNNTTITYMPANVEAEDKNN